MIQENYFELEEDEFLRFLEDTEENTYKFMPDDPDLESETSNITNPEEVVEAVNEAHSERPAWEVEVQNGVWPLSEPRYTARARYSEDGKDIEMDLEGHEEIGHKYSEPGEFRIEGILTGQE